LTVYEQGPYNSLVIENHGLTLGSP
jgi:hypothetical protein